MQPKHDHLALEEFRRTGFIDEVAVPIAAVSKQAIIDYIGVIDEVVSEDREGRQALLVNIYKKDNKKTLRVFDLPESDVFFSSRQLWAHVDFGRYRATYKKTFPNESIEQDDFIDHVLNRKVARACGFNYIRLVAVPRRVNTEHGSLNESWELKDMLADPTVMERRQAARGNVRYADWADLVKMLKIKTGGRSHLELYETLSLFEDLRIHS